MHRFTLLAVLLTTGCVYTSQPDTPTKADTAAPAAPPLVLAVATPRPDLHVHTETVQLPIDADDYSTYEGKTFNNMIDYFPTLYRYPPLPPDSSYEQSGIAKSFKDSSGHIQQISFGSEGGQDEYHVIYAWFLSKKMTPQSKARAKRLAEIYRAINSIKNRLMHGGTGFGHTYKRIAGYSAYDGWLYAQNAPLYTSGRFIAGRNVYIDSVKALINRELAEQLLIHEASLEDKIEILHKADALGRLITDSYYLQKAIAFTRSYGPYR